jgi:hypothetical protein
VNSKEIKGFIKKARRLARPFRVTDDSFRLKNIDPGDTLKFTSEDKPRAKSWPRQNAPCRPASENQERRRLTRGDFASIVDSLPSTS